MKLNKRRLALNTVQNTRKTIAKLLRDFNERDEDDPLDRQDYRLLLDGLRQLLQGYRVESDLVVQERLEALERKINESNKRGTALVVGKQNEPKPETEDKPA